MSGVADFYIEPGLITAIPDPGLFAALASDSRSLREIVSGLVIHPDMMHLYGRTALAGLAELNLRPVPALLDILRQRCDCPLSEPRAPDKRLLGSCRHYAVLLCAMLRAKGVPSRVRSGFANYFEPGTWEDHWLTEWQAPGANAWRRVDAEFDDVLTRFYQIAFDLADVPDEVFMTGPEAWRRYRRGEVDPQLFGIYESRGPRFIAGTVVRDLACLCKYEMLPWDYWGYIGDLSRRVVDLDEAFIDGLADAVLDGDLADTQRAYRTPGVSVPADLRQVRADR